MAKDFIRLHLTLIVFAADLYRPLRWGQLPRAPLSLCLPLKDRTQNYSLCSTQSVDTDSNTYLLYIVVIMCEQ